MLSDMLNDASDSLARSSSLPGLVLLNLTALEEHLASYPQCAKTSLLDEPPDCLRGNATDASGL